MKESQKQNRNLMFSVITNDKQKTGVNQKFNVKAMPNENIFTHKIQQIFIHPTGIK